MRRAKQFEAICEGFLRRFTVGVKDYLEQRAESRQFSSLESIALLTLIQ